MNFSKSFTFAISLLIFHSLSFALPNFVVVGIPGSGKGTFSQYLVEHYGYKQVSIGDLIRSHVRNNTELGKKIQETVKKGEYIDDTITVQLISQKIEEFNAQKMPFIIDGFPRNQYCLDHLQQLLHTLDLTKTMHCIHIDTSDSICAQRISKRLVCLGCSKIHTLEQFENREQMQCTCGCNVVKRDFDDPEKTLNRINFYRKSIEPITVNLKQLYPSHSFNTSRSVSECHSVYKNFMEHFDKPSKTKLEDKSSKANELA